MLTPAICKVLNDPANGNKGNDDQSEKITSGKTVIQGKLQITQKILVMFVLTLMHKA